MPALRELQPALRALQSGMSTAIREAAAQERPRPRLLAAIAQPERLALHVRNFRSSLTAVLVSIFPATQRLAGEGFFAFAAAQFIAASPPRDPILAHYGAAFPGFLAALPALAKSPWLAEAARLEWTIHALADELPAESSSPLRGGVRSGGCTALTDLSALATHTDARFTWHPGVTLFYAPSPAADLIDPDGDLAALDLTQPCQLLLTPGTDGVVQHDLTADAFAFLCALQAGQPLSAALAATPPHTSFDPAATLRLAARTGCFAALHPIEDFQS